jgi:hypothetical protein
VIGVDVPTIGETQTHTIRMLHEIGQPMAEIDALEADRVRQHGLQVRTVYAPIGAPELLAITRFATMLSDHFAAAPVPIDQRGYFSAHRVEGCTQSHSLVKPRRIRRQRDCRSDLAKLVGLLVDLRVDAMFSQGEREREAADASTDYCDLQIQLFHGVSPVFRLCV